MRIILFCIYATGAALSLVCFSFLEWWIALAIVILFPIAVLHLAESKGIVQFGQVKTNPKKLRSIDKAAMSDMSDEEAADTFGWQIVREMDETINSLESMLKEAKEKRDGFADLIKGENK